MKKLLIFLNTLLVLFATSCKKKEVSNPLADFANLGIGSYITLASTINTNFDYDTPSSEAAITVNQYGGEVDQIVLYVVEGANADPTSWKKIKTIQFTGNGTKIAATEQEVATALGVATADLSPGNFYTFYNQVITKDGRKFDVSNSPGAIESNSNYKTVLRWQAYITCPFTGGMTGNYKVMQDDWQDWSPGDIVKVTDGPGANQINLSEVWPNPAYGDVKDPLIVNINPANGTATVPLTTFGVNYPGTATARGASAGDVAGYVFSCTGFITLNMAVTYNGGSQGNLKLILQKQ
jgi:hypothetical protein